MGNRKLNPEMIEGLIDGVDYFKLRTLTICVLTLSNGAMVTGESNVIDPANYDETIGRAVARSDAVGKIWRLEGYAMKTRGN